MDARAHALLQQAVDWRLIGLLFECPVGAWRDDLVALGRDTDDPLLRSAVTHALEEASEGLYHSTFGPGGPAPPREVTYVKAVQLGYLLSELTAFYDAFAYQPVTRESLDHVSVEAGFIGYLLLKQAYAAARGDEEQAAVTADAAATFTREHLTALAEPLATTLDASGVAYLAEAARALATRVGPPPSAIAAPAAGRLLPVIQPLEDEDEIACEGTGGPTCSGADALSEPPRGDVPAEVDDPFTKDSHRFISPLQSTAPGPPARQLARRREATDITASHQHDRQDQAGANGRKNDRP